MIGTRPEAIKLAPVARALAARGIAPSLTLTGQHPALNVSDYGLSDYPAVYLDCPGEQNPHRHVRRATAATLAHLRAPPDLLVVQGDTSSALGAALAGFSMDVPVAHVEAGLRTHDPTLPWPEEQYRVAIDARAELLFAPTEIAARNLRLEGVAGSIHVTGNSGIDALLEVVKGWPPRAPSRSSVKVVLVTCHRRESWGAGMKSIAGALIDLAQRPDIRIEVIQHLNPHVSRCMKDLLHAEEGLTLLPPCGHPELVARVRDADLVLSDSGGIQEEAPALGTPLLVLREKTERPEGIFTGNMRLVGTSTAAIVRAASRLLDDPAELARMARPRFPYGDGSAGPRIAELIDAWLIKRQNDPAGPHRMSRSEANNFR